VRVYGPDNEEIVLFAECEVKLAPLYVSVILVKKPHINFVPSRQVARFTLPVPVVEVVERLLTEVISGGAIGAVKLDADIQSEIFTASVVVTDTEPNSSAKVGAPGELELAETWMVVHQ
jgi:hypothetical protein